MRQTPEDLKILKNISINLGRLLRERGLTQMAVAAKAGTTSANMSRLAHGIFLPNVALVARIAAALDCTIDELIEAPAKEKKPPSLASARG
jgi:transcriptional regulator with XRE-family HTH domain